MSGRAWLAVAAGAVLTIVAVVAIGRPGGDRALDPRSHDRLGTSAMVALAGELGADVAIDDRLPDLGGGPAGAGPDVIVLFADLLDSRQRSVLEGWIDAGGRLVVTDPGSPFAPPSVGTFVTLRDLGGPTVTGRCEIDALGGVDVAGIEPRHGGVLFEPDAGSTSCVGDQPGVGYIIATDQGTGTVVALGGSGLVVNAALAEGENAAVVGALVAPEAGTDVLVLEPGRLAAGSGGDRTLAELVPSAVKRAIVMLAVAFVIYALWRARRLGRPVPEPQPVAVAGSELVAAVGNLLDRTRSPAHAAELLRADLRRFLADQLGLPAASPPDVVAAVAAERTRVDEHQLRWALGAPPRDSPMAGPAAAAPAITDDAGLVALARTIDHIREEVLAHV
jgi:hypothetical protein